jgi:hypothetical protein
MAEVKNNLLDRLKYENMLDEQSKNFTSLPETD